MKMHNKQNRLMDFLDIKQAGLSAEEYMLYAQAFAVHALTEIALDKSEPELIRQNAIQALASKQGSTAKQETAKQNSFKFTEAGFKAWFKANKPDLAGSPIEQDPHFAGRLFKGCTGAKLNDRDISFISLLTIAQWDMLAEYVFRFAELCGNEDLERYLAGETAKKHLSAAASIKGSRQEIYWEDAILRNGSLQSMSVESVAQDSMALGIHAMPMLELIIAECPSVQTLGTPKSESESAFSATLRYFNEARIQRTGMWDERSLLYTREHVGKWPGDSAKQLVQAYLPWDRQERLKLGFKALYAGKYITDEQLPLFEQDGFTLDD